VLTMLTVLTQTRPFVRREFGCDARQSAPPWGERGVARDDYLPTLIRTLFVPDVGSAGTQATFTDNRVR
jgi:hypothetical protein